MLFDLCSIDSSLASIIRYNNHSTIYVIENCTSFIPYFRFDISHGFIIIAEAFIMNTRCVITTNQNICIT